jgi:hypothetical protein
MSFSTDNRLTPAGEAFVLGYMASAAPELAAEAMEHLEGMEADGVPPGPGYWIRPLT